MMKTKITAIMFLLMMTTSMIIFGQDPCFDCPPHGFISADTIDSIRLSRALHGATVDLDFNVDSRFIVRIEERLEVSRVEGAYFLTTLTKMSDDQYVYWGDSFRLNVDSTLHQVAFSAISDVFATGTGEGLITFWEPLLETSIHSIQGEESPITDMLFHPQEDWLAAVSDYQRVGIYALEADSVQWLDLPDTTENVTNISFNAGGDFLVVGVDEAVIFWQVSEGLDFVDSFSIDADLEHVLFHPQECTSSKHFGHKRC